MWPSSLCVQAPGSSFSLMLLCWYTGASHLSSQCFIRLICKTKIYQWYILLGDLWVSGIKECHYYPFLFKLLHLISHLQHVRHFLACNSQLHLPNLIIWHPSYALGKKKHLLVLQLPQIHITSVNSSRNLYCSQCMPYLKKVMFHIKFSKTRGFRANSCLIFTV